MKNDKLIVLDLDETLFHCDIIDMDGFDYTFVLDGKYSYWTIKRPHLDTFINYIKDNFNYGVYTASTKDYAEKHCEILGLDPLFLLHRDNCTPKFDMSGDIYQLKRLSKVKKYSPSKIIAIDDKHESYSENYGNLIRVTPFYGGSTDTTLLKLIDYLEKIKNIEDIRRIEKRGWMNSV